MDHSQRTREVPFEVVFEETVKPAFEEYRDLERAFLLGLSEKDRFALDGGEPKPISEAHLRLLERSIGKPLSKNDPRRYLRKSDKPSWYFAAHFRFHIQVLMTLCGLKPVTLFSHPNFSGRLVLERMAEQCLRPVLEKYNFHSYGMLLKKIEHPMIKRAGPNYQGVMVFANWDAHMKASNRSVEHVFFTMHPGKVLPRDLMSKILGIPKGGRPTMGEVQYKDMTEMAKLWEVVGMEPGKDKEEFFVPGMRYYCDDGDVNFQASIDHFNKWIQIAYHAGVNLTHDTSLHGPFKAWEEQKRREVEWEFDW